MPIGLSRIAERLRRDRRGVSAVEFAIVASIMVVILLGAYDFGNAAQQQIQLQEAVRSGGAYAISRPTDVTGIQSAVAGALPAGWQLTNPGGVAAVSCSCMDPGSGALSAPATGSACTAANLDTCSAKAISITASMAYLALTPLFAAAIPNNTASYVVRFQ